MSILDLFRLDGQVALVTGVGRGLGQAIALALAEAGADIAGVYHTKIHETAQLIQDTGRRFLPIQCNLLTATPDDLTGIIQQVSDHFGGLHILVNNAGITRRAPILEFTPQDWDDVIQVNLSSVFFLSQAAARSMTPLRRGKIINIASLLSFQGGILVPSYTAAKTGILGLTRLFANELASQGVNVNAIAPGYIETDLTASLKDNPVRGPAILERIPAGRWGQPSDLQGAAVFLASRASDYVHGAVLLVDGGWYAR